MSDPDGKQSNKLTIFLGLVCIVIGTMPLLTALGVFPHGKGSSDATSSLTTWLLGLVFACTGLLVIMRCFTDSVGDVQGELPASAPRLMRGAYVFLSIAIVCSLALVLTWIAFGPGPRHFAVSIGGLWTMTSGFGDTLGRAAFGYAGVLLWGFLLAILAVTVLRPRR